MRGELPTFKVETSTCVGDRTLATTAENIYKRLQIITSTRALAYLIFVGTIPTVPSPFDGDVACLSVLITIYDEAISIFPIIIDIAYDRWCHAEYDTLLWGKIRSLCQTYSSLHGI
jgi:hypothetical protein